MMGEEVEQISSDDHLSCYYLHCSLNRLLLDFVASWDVLPYFHWVMVERTFGCSFHKSVQFGERSLGLLCS